MKEKQLVQDVGSRKDKVSKEFGSYITGFVDGEGCFSISFNKRYKLKTGIEVRPSFSIAQNRKSLRVLKMVKAYFGCGAIRFSKYDQMYKYEVRSIKDLKNRIIPHFQKYQLQTNKQNDFVKFEWICQQISASKHLHKPTLKEIISQAYQMNSSGKRKYEQEYLLKMLAR